MLRRYLLSVLEGRRDQLTSLPPPGIIKLALAHASACGCLGKRLTGRWPLRQSRLHLTSHARPDASSRQHHSTQRTGLVPCASHTAVHDTIPTLSLRRIHSRFACTPAPGRRMASNLVMTPQQSFAASPQHSQAHPTPHGLPTGFSQSFNMPYDGSPHAHAHPPAQHHAQQQYSQSFPNGPISNPGYARSFGDGYGPSRNNYGGKPQIYTVCAKVPAGAVRHAC